jgi:hypothetical protein
MLLLILMIVSVVSFIAFPDSKEALLANEKSENIKIESSGSLGIYRDGKCVKTHPNETLISNERFEWCSNIAKDKNDPKYNPWIQFSLKGKKMAVTKYSVRNGCCYYACCCDEENGKVTDYSYCCCYLYSYSLQASNDNITWKTLHKVEKDASFDLCQTKTFELDEKSKPYTYFRFVLDEEYPNCYKCMQVNQIELYGERVNYDHVSYSESSDEDYSISIIGRVMKNEQ